MPPLIAFAGALGGLAVVRWAYRTAMRVNRELEEARLARLAEAARTAGNSDPAAGSQHRRLPPGLTPSPNTSSWPGLTRPSTPSSGVRAKTWMPGSSPGMTSFEG